MKKVIIILLMFSFVFIQEPCEGSCLSEEETNNLFNNIQECELDLDKYKKLNLNLDDQIKMYMEKDELNKQRNMLLNDKMKLYDELVKQVKPKWYENKWLWFTLGAITTAGTLKLASDIVE